MLWAEFGDELKKTYWGKEDFVASCGGVIIKQLKKYVLNQDSPEQ